MPIGDMPILEVLIRQMKRHGIEEIILTVGHLSELLRTFFQDGSRFGVRIEYSYEEEPLGTAGPLAMVDGLNDTFLVTNGDVLTTLDLGDLIEYHLQEGATATIAMHSRKVQIDLGVIKFNGRNEVIDYVEKPSMDYEVSMGIYVFEPKALEYIPQASYMDFPDLVLKLLEHGQRVVGFPFDGYWQDLGRQDDYLQATAEFEQMRSQFLGEA
jgi:NDP-sugar pyrophosphorylase family protein